MITTVINHAGIRLMFQTISEGRRDRDRRLDAQVADRARRTGKRPQKEALADEFAHLFAENPESCARRRAWRKFEKKQHVVVAARS